MSTILFDQKLLSKMVSIDSHYPKEFKLSTFMEEYMVSKGYSVERQYLTTNRFNLMAKKGKQPKLLYYGHLDTVDVKPSEWTTHPFKLTKRGNRLYGRGAYDMKGGIVAFLSAIEKTKADIKILLAVDEENISEGAWNAVKDKKRFFEGIRLIVSAEPNFGTGLNTIVTGRSGRCIYTIDFIGKQVHIAEYQKGKDAVNMAADFIVKLYKKRRTLFKSRETLVQVRKIKGESEGMSVCGKVNLEIEVLLDAKDSISSVKKGLQSLTGNEVKLKARKTPYLQGYVFKEFPYQNEISHIVEDNTGQKMKLTTRNSVGDDNVLVDLGIPVITWGPSGGNAHAANEFVDKKSLNILTKMYNELLKIV